MMRIVVEDSYLTGSAHLFAMTWSGIRKICLRFLSVAGHNLHFAYASGVNLLRKRLLSPLKLTVYSKRIVFAYWIKLNWPEEVPDRCRHSNNFGHGPNAVAPLSAYYGFRNVAANSNLLYSIQTPFVDGQWTLLRYMQDNYDDATDHHVSVFPLKPYVYHELFKNK